MGLSSQNGFCNLFQDKCNAVVLFGVRNMNLIPDALQYSITNMPVQGKVSYLFFFFFFNKPWNMQDRNCHHVQPCDFFKCKFVTEVLFQYYTLEASLTCLHMAYPEHGVRSGGNRSFMCLGFDRPSRPRPGALRYCTSCMDHPPFLVQRPQLHFPSGLDF